ncbi:MAG: CsbD family protein [Citromicrobium sp.]|nr:MAG: CsbD family protein [Citromicrobium sp.]
MANEAIGNVKQAVGSAVGSESLRQSGLAQERKGEAQQQTGEQLGNRGNEL